MQFGSGDHWRRAGSPQQQAVLAVLLLRAGRLVTADGLVDAVWGDAPPSSVITVLRTNIWRLRRILEAVGARDSLVSVADGYRLDVEPAAVDALRAELLLSRAEELRRERSFADQRRTLLEALALWQGVPLAGVPGPFAEQQRSRLEELHFAVREELFKAELAEGNASSVIPGLTALSAESPLREGPYELLMRALYEAGRRSDALIVYRQVRERLRGELGIEPSSELRDLHVRILADTMEVPARPGDGPAAGEARERVVTAASAAAGAPPAAGAAPAVPAATTDTPPTAHTPDFTATPAQLPSGIPDFVGRDATLRLLETAVDAGEGHTPLIASITGMGGVGKSVLALRFAHQVKARFPDGQLYADLYGTADDPERPKVVLDGFLTALGVPRSHLPPDQDGASRLLRTMLADRRILLLLDDARDAAQVRPLLPGSTGSAVAVTSRTKLIGLPIGVQVDLDVFTREEAWELLTRVVGAKRVAAEPAGAERLLAACGQLPLAVRIAAVRLAARPQWSIGRLADRLADSRRRLSELRVGDLAVTNAFELSHRMLSPAQARAFRLLACVTRSTSLESGCAVLGLPEGQAEELLESLVDVALLESPQPASYRFHELVRSFAAELPAEEENERVEAFERLMDHLRAGAYRAFQAILPGDPVADLLVPSGPFRPAFASLADARAWVHSEFVTAVDAIRSAAHGTPANEGALAAAADLGVLLSAFGREIPYDQLADAAELVAGAAERAGDDLTAGRARFVCGNAHLQNLRLDTAEEHLLAARGALHRVGKPALIHQVLNDLGLISQLRQRYAEAGRRHDEAAALARAVGHRLGELVFGLNAALARLHDGRPDEARVAARAALGPLRSLGHAPGLSFGLYVYGLALHELGRHREALSAFEECLQICTEAGVPGREGMCRARLADTLRALGRPEQALPHAVRGLELCRERGDGRDTGRARLILSRVLGALGRWDEAAARTAEALAEFRRLGLAEAATAQAQLREQEGDRARQRQQSSPAIRVGSELQTPGV
ncbi:AfsR/SARP family transcriptional regulator [Streptomyces sp. Ru62]|uniref:AfsR/SARP family transcriptional regulator n=1 Tax=Streptomyces sp. Ru62 TaxID=2080745 RepID=UPI0015E36B16|nr:AfsR/SARP family transcriptional regulator [Streptomyces sp. Ru62]